MSRFKTKYINQLIEYISKELNIPNLIMESNPYKLWIENKLNGGWFQFGINGSYMNRNEFVFYLKGVMEGILYKNKEIKNILNKLKK